MDAIKILFFKPGAIGDFLHTLPTLSSLKNHYPDAHITVVVSPGVDSLIQGTDIADAVLIYDKRLLKKHPAEFLQLGLRLRRERYDLFVDLQPSIRSLILRKIAAAARTLVYRKQKKTPVGGRRLHAAENFAKTLAPIGIDNPVEHILLPLSEKTVAEAGRFLARHGVREDKPLVALNCSVGAARPARNWFPERFADLADRLIEQAGVVIVFVGGAEDRGLVAAVCSRMKNKAISATGELSLAQTAGLLSRCACLVSSDTGPLHLATAVQTPVVGLYGSTDPTRTGPVGKGHAVIIKDLPCIPCEEKDCPQGTRPCMAAITVDEVYESVVNMVLRKKL